jgi:hypothetical protein
MDDCVYVMVVDWKEVVDQHSKAWELDRSQAMNWNVINAWREKVRRLSFV